VTLSIVPTPLGNLDDISARSLSVLKNSSAVYCEDTRHTRQLMSHFGISKPLLHYDERNPRSADEILGRLGSGAELALVSDSGFPGVSDPGSRLVWRARKGGLAVTALPGPSAVTTAVAGSGLPADSFVFLGFLPRSPGRQKKKIEQAAALEVTIVIYESPFRVLHLLENAASVLGEKAQCCIAREISKVHEEWLFGSIADVRQKLSEKKSILGEFVVMFHPTEFDQAPDAGIPS
jgi:16S rRNA (cytidine1402-2'-O)-methyltransferase